MKMYLVRWKDGSLGVFSMKPEKEHFSEDAEFYECDPDLTIAQIGLALGFDMTFETMPETVAEKMRRINNE